MLKAIIIDDELKSRESLEILINDFCDGVEVMALCQNINDAVSAIKKHNPDLVFLDIQLQSETGFDLFNRFDEIKFEVVFTTAYSEYAVKAFKFSAIDYLLKPIDISELRDSISRIEKRSHDSISDRLSQLVKSMRTGTIDDSKLALPTADGFEFINAKDILYCEASSNYTEIYTRDGKKYIVSRTLKEYEELLSDQNFFRIHHAYIVNLNEIKKYVRGDGGYVIMNNDKSLDVSKRKKEGFLSRIQGLK